MIDASLDIGYFAVLLLFQVCFTSCRSHGVLLWEIMTLGRNPYPGVDNRDLLEQIEENGLKLAWPKKSPTAV